MPKYISMLRGVNVGGKRKILMADLRELYKSLGFTNITTYIQSGNVIFDLEKKEKNEVLIDKIKNAISEQYGFDVPVVIRSVNEIKKVIKNNPFLKNNDVDISKLYVTFLAEKPAKEKLEKIKDFTYPPDEYVIDKNNIYICFDERYSLSKLTNNFFESKLKVSATSRNWKTVNKLLELSKK